MMTTMITLLINHIRLRLLTLDGRDEGWAGANHSCNWAEAGFGLVSSESQDKHTETKLLTDYNKTLEWLIFIIFIINLFYFTVVMWLKELKS